MRTHLCVYDTAPPPSQVLKVTTTGLFTVPMADDA
jgi:hypothetical protein